MAQTRTYTDVVNRVCGLIGIPYSGMTSDEQTFLQGYFNSAMNASWDDTAWIDLSPYGEARFAGDLLTYPNDLSKTAYWTAVALTITGNGVANPADGRVTASKLLETTATSAHSVSQAHTFSLNNQYQYSAYVRPNGRNYVYLTATDGVGTYTGFFNVATGVIGTTTGTNQASTITQCNNGFWLCSIYFTSNIAAGVGSATTQVSTDGVTLSYAGDATKGLYVWGEQLLKLTNANPTLTTIPWEQTGEEAIDATFEIWRDNPNGASNPRRQAYQINVNGMQILSQTGYGYGTIYSTVPSSYNPTAFPVYLYYRRRCPDYSAAAYSALTAYAVDDQILFTSSAGVMNFYKCAVATSVGQSPATTAASWTLQVIPEVLFHYAVYAAYADWLTMDGQMDKSQMAMQKADERLTDEFDKQERQMGQIPEMRTFTHVTSQPRY